MSSRAALRVLAVWAFASGGVIAWHVTPVTVTSNSMAPGLPSGQRVVALSAGTTLASITGLTTRLCRRGQVVLVKSPLTDKLLVKRIVAVGGDRVRISQGALILNGFTVFEPYAGHGTPSLRSQDSWPVRWNSSASGEYIVPQAYVFVLGDNRSESMDSRQWGPVRTADVLGFLLSWGP
jgi:signal peptidase I